MVLDLASTEDTKLFGIHLMYFFFLADVIFGSRVIFGYIFEFYCWILLLLFFDY